MRKRINEIIEKYSPHIIGLVGEGTEEFAKNIENTRNYLTYLDEQMKKNVAKGTDLVTITKFLRLILMAAIHTEMGIDPKKASKLVEIN